MQPRKTDLARQALSIRDGSLSMRERRVLILCDGQRGVEELTSMLGPETPSHVRRLRDAGYLVAIVEAPPPQAPLPAPALVPAPASEPGTASTRRRSLVAAKLYLLGMLELQRHPDVARQRERLQAAHSDEDTLAQLFTALHCLRQAASPTLAQRVRERLTEVLPEPYLPALQQADPTPAAA